ncbi:Hsp70 family protein, partial [Bacillus pumilus]|uniref:Hsp70 family protein n=1 Tax=Bacillus pumilus TaxID=1408 RepID=UPI0011A1C3AE
PPLQQPIKKQTPKHPHKPLNPHQLLPLPPPIQPPLITPHLKHLLLLHLTPLSLPIQTIPPLFTNLIQPNTT